MPLYRHRVSGPGSAGDQWVCTMHSFSSVDIDTVAAAWRTFLTSFITDTLGPMWKTTTQSTGSSTDQLDSDGLHNVDQRLQAGVLAGTGTGAAVSPRNTLVIGLRTASPTRAGRGRMSWPSPDASHYETTGLFKAADITAIADGFRTALLVFRGTSIPQIVHRGHEGTPFNTPSTYDPVVNVNIGTVSGTLRSRTNKVANTRVEEWVGP